MFKEEAFLIKVLLLIFSAASPGIVIKIKAKANKASIDAIFSSPSPFD